MTRWKETLGLRAFGLFKIPLIFSCRPTVEALDDRAAEIKIPLNFWTRNHLKSMYFGTLAIGADCAGGLLAMHLIRKSGKKLSLVFRDFRADFLRRPESDVHFRCEDGAKVRRLIASAIKTKKRVSQPVRITATTPKVSGTEPVAVFDLTLSLKPISDHRNS